MPWTLGPGSRQTEKQQTRKPARQRANRPRNQETKKPTRQQTNTTTSKKSRDEPPNQPKNNQKINQNGSKIGLGGCLGLLGSSWAHLGAKKATRAENPSKSPLVDPPLESQVGTKNSLEIGPEACQKVIIFLIGCGVGFCCHLVPTWLQLGRQNPPKIDPSWSPNPSKKGSRCSPIFCLNFDRSWDACLSILLRSWKAKGPKNIENHCFFKAFLLFQATCQQEAIRLIFWSTWL
ncbi:MAG: hypothetical protein VXY56_13860, partial [Pseudomonadota bacterium]|nr:hypothetical protein [Pseudomonadota bacterium]